MDIIANVDNRRVIANYKDYLSTIPLNSINMLRFNMAKWDEWDEIENVIINVEGSIREKVLFDFPIPNNKVRVYTKGKKFKRVHKNRLNKIWINPSLSVQGTFFCYTDIDIKKEVKRHYIEYGDGEVVLHIINITDEYIEFKTDVDFMFINGKGINVGKLENTLLKSYNLDRMKSILEKTGVNQVALSFVHSSKEVIHIRKILGGHIRLISKIEDQIGINNIKEIQEASDDIMLGRGDLGIYCDSFKIGIFQQEILKTYSNVYVATDILNSFKYKEIPNRADIIDVTNIFLNKAKGILLPIGIKNYEYVIEFINNLEKEIEKFDV